MKKTLPCLALATALLISGCTLYDNTGDSDRVVTLEDQAYFLQVRKAVVRDDRKWLSTQVALPLCCFPDREHSYIRTRADFINHYDEVFNPYLRDLLRRYDKRKLTKDWAGVAVGKNVMWLVPFGPHGGPLKYQIFAIKNTPPPGWVAPVVKQEEKKTPLFPFLKKKIPEATPPAAAHEELKPGATVPVPPSAKKKKPGIIDWLLERE